MAISMEDKLQQSMSNTLHSNIFNGKLFFKQADTNNTVGRWQWYKKDINRHFLVMTCPDTKRDGLWINRGEELVDLDEAIPDQISTEMTWS